MKSSYTKRALAFWLAVAMVATSAPMAFAADLATGAPMSPTTSDVGTPVPVAATEIKKVTISKNTVTVDGKTTPQDITVKAFSNEDGLEQNDITSKVDWSVTTTDGQQSDVTVDASGKVTVSAKAKKGTYTITAKGKASETTGTDWSVTTTDGQQSDVTVDASGKVTVSAKAKKGTYTITAKGKASETTGTGTTTLTVSRTGEDVATSVTVSGGATQLEIPATNTVVEATFTAEAKNAFDDSLPVIWSVATTQSDKVFSGGATQLEIPATNTVVEATFTAEAKNAFDDSLPVIWSVATTQSDKVSIDTAGKLTVKQGAVPETVKVQATCGAVKSEEKTVDIKYADSKLQSITEVWMSGDSSDVNVTDGLTLEAGKSATLFVKGLDQYNKEFTVQEGVTVAAKSAPSSNLTFDGAKVTANDGATADTTETIVVTSNDKTKEISVRIQAKATQDITVSFATKPEEKNVYGSAITAPTIKVGDAVPAADDKVRYEYREIADKAALVSNDVLTTMPKNVGKYQVMAYYDSKDGSKHGSVSTTFEITKKPVTVTADNKTITKGDAIPTLTFTVPTGALAYNDTKDALGVTLTTKATSTSDTGTYNITGTADSKNYEVEVETGTLTIKAEEGLRMSASKASDDSNRSRYDLSVRRGAGYLDLNADADDYLSRQTVDGSKDYWIGFDLDVYLDGASKNIQDLYVSSTGKSTEWKKISDLNNSRRYIGDFYLDNLSGTRFTLWFDTDDDSDNSDRLYFATSSSGANEYYIDVDFDAYRGSSSSSSGDSDNSDRLYFATSSSGANEYYIDVDFDAYRGSSSSSSGSSSSDTSKVDGDRVSTTTVDKTPSVKNGSATVTFSSSALSDALDENKKEAKREDADKTYIELDVKTSKSVDDTTITVPRSSLDKIADEHRTRCQDIQVG